MLSFLSKIFKVNKVNVVGIFKSENTIHYQLLSVVKKNNALQLAGKRSFNSFDDFEKVIPKNIPLIITILGKGVVNKQIDLNNTADTQWWNQLDKNTLAYTVCNSGNLKFVSLIRNNQMEELLLPFNSAKYDVIDIYVGTFITQVLKPMIASNSILSSDLTLEFEGENLIAFNRVDADEKKKYDIENDTISNNEMPLYASIVQFFVKQEQIENVNASQNNYEEWIYKNAFNKVAVGSLIFFFTALLISFLGIQKYASRNNELKQELLYSGKTIQKIKSLEFQKEKSNNLLRQTGGFSKKFISYYAYELAKNCPKSISLNEINIFPIDKDVKANKPVILKQNTILVKGETMFENDINDWINEMKKNPVFEKVEIGSIKKDKNNSTLFELITTVNHV